MKPTLIFLFFISFFSINGQNFTELVPSPFIKVGASAAAIGDVNGDGFDDVFLIGATFFMGNQFLAELYLNDGNGSFVPSNDTVFLDMAFSEAEFFDFEGDGDLDLLVTGRLFNNNSSDVETKLYINDGNGNFEVSLESPFGKLTRGTINFIDFNNDGLKDLFLAGLLFVDSYSDLKPISTIFFNEGGGNYVEMEDSPFFIPLNSKSISFSDINGDLIPDVLIAGTNTILYLSNGTNGYIESTNELESAQLGTADFFDVNNDGFDDILLTGVSAVDDIRKMSLYINDGLGSFNLKEDSGLEGVWFSAVGFIDLNNDEIKDLLVLGQSVDEYIRSIAYYNDGEGNFTSDFFDPFKGSFDGTLDIGDFNNDGKEDIIFTGHDQGFAGSSALCYNNTISSNQELKASQINQFSIFPNPSSGSDVIINYEGSESGKVSVKVINMNGVLVHEQKDNLSGSRKDIFLRSGDLSSGMYLVEFHTESNKEVIKLLVK